MVGLVHKTKHIDQKFEYQTIWNRNFKKLGIQMVNIQIPNVYHNIQKLYVGGFHFPQGTYYHFQPFVYFSLTLILYK